MIWGLLALIVPPVLVIIVARMIRRRQEEIDAVIGEPEFGDPPAGDYLGRLNGGKFG